MFRQHETEAGLTLLMETLRTDYGQIFCCFVGVTREGGEDWKKNATKKITFF